MRGLILLAALLCPLPAAADSILVACAANFAPTLRDIATAFERHSGHQLRISPGSSGQLHAQILGGAPFDLFLSADQAKPAALIASGHGVSRRTYAIGALVLWSADPEAVDDQGSVLQLGRFSRLALANPRLAPYGAAAVEVLEHLGLADATRERWVMGQNIAQTLQFVASGNAPIGLVAATQLRNLGGSAWTVPAALHSPIRQDAVLLRADKAAARELMAYLTGAPGRHIIESWGYRLPEPAP